MKKFVLPEKPTYIKLGQDIDYYNLFQKIEQEFASCFLLESLGEESNVSRYAIIGFDPEAIISAKGKCLVINGKKYKADNPYELLQKIFPQGCIARNYAGGLVGYIGYDAISFFEESLSVKKHKKFDRFLFGFFTDGIIYDKVTGELVYFYYKNSRIEQLFRIIKSRLHKVRVRVTSVGLPSMTKKKHVEAILKVKQEILSGNTFQSEIGIQKEFVVTGDTIVLYTKLRKINPSPFMYYIKLGDKKIIGASPELLLGMRNKEVVTFPLAGTIKRGRTRKEDLRLARKLLSDPKEIAEHNMLVDLHRNDLGRVATFGSVKVRSYMDIKKFSHVQHISSEIVGLLAPGEDMFSALSKNFPAGTLSGAPKIESMKIIDKLESAPRGPYGGAVGHFGFNGDCTFAIPIRTIFISGNYGFTQAASGIVADSIPEKEYDEIQRKLAAMLEVLGL